MDIQKEIKKRRTFAIISHPDAGKTTLTEKLLLYSGMIHTAGMVRARKGRKGATSDWMAMEQERGISITASAMQFVYKDAVINVLDTPGHADFSVDTYRTLTAADCAIMVIDAAKGVEQQTRKLFEACTLRKIPVLTFINKMDMPGKGALDLLAEVESVLGIHASPMNWPVGAGNRFLGVYDFVQQEVMHFEKMSIGGMHRAEAHRSSLDGVDMPADEKRQLKGELALLETAGNPFHHGAFLDGKITPVFFGSALTNFGVEPFFDAFLDIAPWPRPYLAHTEQGDKVAVDPVTTPFSGYVFKLQANMDRKHRDNMAFVRICSGVFDKDMHVRHHRSNREIRLTRPHGMIAGERMTVARMYAGDILGVINPGLFAIGDTISVTGGFDFVPLPQFPPEVFARLHPQDISKRKSFDKGVQQLAAEGTVQLLYSEDGLGGVIFATVGALQFDVMQYRLKSEYNVDVVLTPLPYTSSAWLVGDVLTFRKTTGAHLARDTADRTIVLFPDNWDKEYAIKQNPGHTLVDIIA